MNDKPERNPVKLGEVFEQSRQNAAQLAEFKHQSSMQWSEFKNQTNERADRLQLSLDRLDARLGQIAERKTDWIGMAAWAAVVLTILGLVGTPIGYFALREADRKDKLVEALDIKLQREFALSLETAKQAAQNIDNNSKERHESVVRLVDTLGSRIWTLEQWNQDRVKSDLEELRQWRIKTDKGETHGS